LLTRNHRQEALCRAYIQAIAARCGMSISTPSPDYGIDLTLNDVASAGKYRFESGYKIDVQAKSMVQERVAGVTLRYDLDARTYDVLRQRDLGTPRVLVVLFLPRDEARWTAQTEQELILRHSAYWLSLQGSGPTGNRRSVRLSIPRGNLFSAEALRGMIRRIKEGGVP
jgi:hypothetical protein